MLMQTVQALFTKGGSTKKGATTTKKAATTVKKAATTVKKAAAPKKSSSGGSDFWVSAGEPGGAGSRGAQLQAHQAWSSHGLPAVGRAAASRSMPGGGGG